MAMTPQHQEGDRRPSSRSTDDKPAPAMWNWFSTALLVLVPLLVLAAVVSAAYILHEQHVTYYEEHPWLIDDTMAPCGESCEFQWTWQKTLGIVGVLAALGAGPALAITWKKLVPIYKTHKRFRLTLIWGLRSILGTGMLVAAAWLLSVDERLLAAFVFVAFFFWVYGLLPTTRHTEAKT